MVVITLAFLLNLRQFSFIMLTPFFVYAYAHLHSDYKVEGMNMVTELFVELR